MQDRVDQPAVVTLIRHAALAFSLELKPFVALLRAEGNFEKAALIGSSGNYANQVIELCFSDNSDVDNDLPYTLDK